MQHFPLKALSLVLALTTLLPMVGGDAHSRARGDVAPASVSSTPEGYRLVWSDEFDVDGLPGSSRWGYDTEGNRGGWYNDELQYYAVGRLENSRVLNGNLIITARHEKLTDGPGDYEGQQYTSARLITRNTATWAYGFFEIRAKLPCGQGTWPAIWMLGADGRPHPANGEIDIMEQTGQDPSTIWSAVHTKASDGTGGSSGSVVVPDACTAFHNYQLTWTPDRLVFRVDGQTFHTYEKPENNPDAWPFDEPQYLLLNLAIGGTMGGEVDDSIFPVEFVVDYVRVYQQG